MLSDNANITLVSLAIFNKGLESSKYRINKRNKIHTFEIKI
jgi:O-methyltransferase involved in polyketide biosynthesis